MQLSEFRTEISSIIGLDNTASSAEQLLIDQWVNEAVVDILSRTSCKVLPGSFTLTAGSDDYTLPTAILSMIDAFTTSSSSDYELRHVTPQDITRMRRNASNSSPARYFAVAGSNLLMVYPTPTLSDTVTLYYVPRPTALAASSDTPSEIPSEWHRVVTLYGLWRAADYDNQDMRTVDRYKREYEAGINMIRRSTTRKGSHRLAPAMTPPRRRQSVSNDPARVVWNA